ncbi:MAG: hypothetical protein ACE5HS_04085 [bacterium]
MFKKILSVSFMILVFMACQQKTKVSNEPLTAADSLNLQLVLKEHVASFAAPPMIPQDHPVAIGEDIEQTLNGGEDCLECHNDPEQKDEIIQTLHPQRHNCLQCHLPVVEDSATDRDFKVANSFEKIQPK